MDMALFFSLWGVLLCCSPSPLTTESKINDVYWLGWPLEQPIRSETSLCFTITPYTDHFILPSMSPHPLQWKLNGQSGSINEQGLITLTVFNTRVETPRLHATPGYKYETEQHCLVIETPFVKVFRFWRQRSKVTKSQTVERMISKGGTETQRRDILAIWVCDK